MNKLFIIGNGFDLAHKLKTKYSDFRDYLVKAYPNATPSSFIPEGSWSPRGGMYFEDDEVVSFYLDIIDSAENGQWKDLETALGVLDYTSCLPSGENYDEDGDPDYRRNALCNEDNSEPLYYIFQKFPYFLKQWIQTIQVNTAKAQNKFKELISNKTDFFLTFNYTDTLEQLYMVEQVCHIHGTLPSELIIGHGADSFDFEELNIEHYGAESSIRETHEILRKQTNIAFDTNMSFFTSLKNISSIYSYGFSFSDVDLIYLKKICSLLPTENIVWYLNCFDSFDEREKLKTKITKCGFKGKFGSFNSK
ncbi:MAG: bacteriophage abortive infection AbiH family protein [Geovibrio sp.]|nr:bacteriophage abortive infection AbiH family protein [Geovibrio sp.]